jgi:L-iditol 2-dehydrogenase
MNAAALEQAGDVAQIPSVMRAAVYRGANDVRVESIPVPEIGAGEILVRVHTCGVCGTDIKKIKHGLAQPPRIFGHEIAGTVVLAGAGVSKLRPGDRVSVHHHIPCRQCFFCERRLFSQCEVYRKTGTTAGFDAAGGGFAEYIRVMDWIVAEGVVPIPEGVTFEEASFMEPLNTCLKALETAELQAGEVVAVLGQGPIGLMLGQAARAEGARVAALDPIERRRAAGTALGFELALDPRQDDAAEAIGGLTDGRGADLVIVATADPRAIATGQALARRGGRVLLFAATVPGEMVPIDASKVCVEEKRLIGSYSASVDLQAKAAALLFSRKIRVAELVSHRFPLDRLLEGIHLAANPSPESLKVLIQP